MREQQHPRDRRMVVRRADPSENLGQDVGAERRAEPRFVDPEQAKDLVRREPVVFAEMMGADLTEPALEVHVMRPAREGLYEVERDDTGPVRGETVRALVARIAARHGCRYATIYPAEDRWPPLWSVTRPASVQSNADRRAQPRTR